MNIQKSKINIGYAAVILAGFSFGSITVISALLRNAGASSLEQACIRLIIGAIFGIIVIFFVFYQKRDIIRNCFKLKIQITYIFQGVLFSAMILAILSSIALNTPAGEAALLVQIQPVFTVLLGTVFLKESLTRIKLSSLFIAMVGLFLITQPWEWSFFLSSLAGDILAILDGFCYALYLLVGRWSNKYRLNIPSSISIAWVLLWGLITGIPIILFLKLLPLPNSIISFSLIVILTPKIFVLGLLLAIFGSIIPYSFIMLSNSYDVESSKQAILLLGDPIGAVILSAILLFEPITIWYIIGGTLLLLSIAIITISGGALENSLSLKNY